MNTETNETREGRAPWAPVVKLGREARDAGRNMWLAGLGAIDTVDERGRGLFSDLVGRGQRFEKRERPILGARVSKLTARVDAMRHRVEQGVESTLGGTLQRFGAPGRGEVHQLIDRIEKLTQEVEGLKPRATS